jgi:hypothetical protein
MKSKFTLSQLEECDSAFWHAFIFPHDFRDGLPKLLIICHVLEYGADLLGLIFELLLLCLVHTGLTVHLLKNLSTVAFHLFDDPFELLVVAVKHGLGVRDEATSLCLLMILDNFPCDCELGWAKLEAGKPAVHVLHADDCLGHLLILLLSLGRHNSVVDVCDHCDQEVQEDQQVENDEGHPSDPECHQK